MQLFRDQASEIDIVITTALIPGRPAPKLWPAEMVGLMKPGSVVVDLAAEQGGNCELTQKDKIVESDNGVKIVGYTDFPSRMAAQSSTLYATNIRHMLDDLTPEKDGVLNVNMEDDVIRGATVVHQGEITFLPPPPKVQAIGKQTQSAQALESTPEEKGRSRAGKRAGHRAPPSWSAGTRWAVYAGFRCICTFQLYAAFHRLCTGLFCWLSGHLECQPFVAHAFDGSYKRHFWHHYYWRAFTNGVAKRFGEHPCQYFCFDRYDLSLVALW